MSTDPSLTPLLIAPTRTLRQAMEQLNANARGIVLVVDDERRLIATITDGDIRRAILNTGDLSLTIAAALSRRDDAAKSVAAPDGTPHHHLLDLMRRTFVRHIPLVDSDGRVVSLVRLEDLVQEPQTLRAVVMAGGLGTRLRPLTDETPKPMLPVGDRPLIEHIIGQLRDVGIHQISVSTHYRPEAIKTHLGDGRQLGVEIDYVTEDSPLGTAGSLALLPEWDSTLLVMNGDILTRLNYRAMLDFHRDQRAVLTVGIREFEFQVPYGVIETDGVEVQQINEKPILQFFVNAGIYLLEPGVRQVLSSGERVDMTDLIRKLRTAGQRVVSFPISEYWLDIGKLENYRQAQADVTSGRF